MKLEVGKRYVARGGAVIEIESESFKGCFFSTEGFKFNSVGKFVDVTDISQPHKYDLVSESGAVDGVYVKTLEITEDDLKMFSEHAGEINSEINSLVTHRYNKFILPLEKRITTLEETLATLIAETKKMADNVIVFQETVSNALKELVPFVLETRMKNGK